MKSFCNKNSALSILIAAAFLIPIFFVSGLRASFVTMGKLVEQQQAKDLVAVKRLIFSGTNTDKLSKMFYLMVLRRNWQAASLLVAHGADPNVIASTGKTVLHNELTRGYFNLDAIKRILAFENTNPTIPFKSGIAPLRYMQERASRAAQEIEVMRNQYEKNSIGFSLKEKLLLWRTEEDQRNSEKIIALIRNAVETKSAVYRGHEQDCAHD